MNKLVVADDLIERAIDMGFLSDDAIIIFDIDTPDQNLLTQYGIELRSEAEIYTHEFSNVNIIIIDRKQETTEKYEYNDADYEPIIIPIPEQAESENTAAPPPADVNPVPSESGYAENSGGDSHYAADDGDSHYGNTATTAVQETTPPMTEPPATNPPSVSPPAAAPSYGDSDYEADSGYGDSMYEAESDYDASDYS